MTNGDTLVTGAGGGKGIMIMLTDYSNGNDMIVGKPGIKSVKDLKGKKIGIEVGLVEHLLLLHALKEAGMKRKRCHVGQRQDQRDAAGARLRPGRCGRRLAADCGPGNEGPPRLEAALHLGQAPGLIYDVLAVSPASLNDAPRRLDQARSKSGTAWCTTSTIRRRRTDAVKIMAARVGLTPEEFHRCSRAPTCSTWRTARRSSRRAKGSTSLYGSTKIADDFNVDNEVYKEGAEGRQLHRSVADRWPSNNGAAATRIDRDAKAGFKF